MSTNPAVILAAAALVAALGAAAADPVVEMTEPSLDAFKGLAGEWVAVGDDGRPTDDVVTSFRVTAAGSAVLEILFAGTDHEMVTVYHNDGEYLMLTHYCAARNAPSMRAQPGPDATTVRFECIGGRNMKSEDDGHMHRATYHFLGEDRITTEWVMLRDGKPDHTARFELARRKKER